MSRAEAAIAGGRSKASVRVYKGVKDVTEQAREFERDNNMSFLIM